MPKPGFHAITLADSIYNIVCEKFAEQQADLAKRGINSISGYITMLLHTGLSADKEWEK